MSAERDVNRIVRSWIRTEEHESADRVLQTVLSRLDTTPQRRHLLPPRRFSDMNKYAQAAIAAAAVLVVAVVGYNLLPRSGSVGGQQTPPPTAQPTPIATPTPSISALQVGPIAPGTYALAWNGPRISFQVPKGWRSEYGFDIRKNPLTSTELGWGGWTPFVEPVFHVYQDACDSEGALKAFDGSVAGLVAALDAQVSTDATITDVVIGGRSAKRVDLVESPGVDRATCRHGAEGPLQIWADPAETNYFALQPGASGFVHALNIDGRLVVLDGVFGGDAAEADVPELNTMLASIEIAE